ncbi:jg10500 [Pararge aegeria aegeria]|uniref:Jg10500 protein n=1 Tax=Pararge aegeria aegeria TaxID=348720 RepID=A0A8S4RL62_9NEOP|nr:jg10500 [Pararge aegeria aegeria]
MLARRFAQCTTQVKLALFRAYCQSFYTCSLWTHYTQRTYNALRVQYNNVLRAVLKKPRRCSASEMFADARVDDFYAIILRKRAASMMSRLVSSTNTLLSKLAFRMDSSLGGCWDGVHTRYRGVIS